MKTKSKCTFEFFRTKAGSNKVQTQNIEIMEAKTVRKHRMASPVTKVWNQAKNLDNSQKLELVSIIIDSMKPAVAKAKETDEEYSLRPFTMEELNARIDQAEANVAAGKTITHEESMRRWKKKIARKKLDFEMADAV